MLLPLAHAVARVRGDERVACRVVDGDTEGERLASQHFSALSNNLLNLSVDLGFLFLALLLAECEVVDDGRQETLDVGELALAGGNLDVQLDKLNDGGIRLDNSALEIRHGG